MSATAVYLTQIEAESFMAWQEHRETFEILRASGVFGTKNGSIELHFNAEGQLASIDAHLKMFRRAKVVHIVHK